VRLIRFLTTGQANEGGRLRTAFLLAAGLLCALLLPLLSRSPAAAAGNATIGFDMQPGDAPVSASGNSQSCISVSPGEEFNADVFVTNVNSLTAWELRVDYDPSIVSLQSADYNFLLVQNGGQIFPSEFVQEKPGRMFLAAADTSSRSSGSGVLARLHLKALSNGVSSLQITTSPTYYGPRLTGARGATIGDVNGDGIFDGAVTGGSVAVGRSCAPSTPAPTPQPGQASPPPGSSPATSPPGSGGAASSGDNPTPGSGASGSGGDIATPGSDNSVGNSNSHDTQPASSPLVANAGSQGGSEPTSAAGAQGGSEPTSAAGAQAGDSNTQANNGDQTGQNAKGNGGGSSSILFAAAVVSALALLAGTGLILARLRWARQDRNT
jgi:Cohesin domain